MMLNKYNSQDSLAEKHQEVLIENLRLQEQIMMKDKIIHQKQFYPLYHYDNRIKTLRDSVAYFQKLLMK